MLQQTQVATVIRYYEQFLARFPDVDTLAAAPLEEILKAWEGLGYYARARNLHAAARHIVAHLEGRLPETYVELLALPGFGRYTAGAVASIAFGQAVPAVDGNVRRVLARVCALEGNPHRAEFQRRVEEMARSLLPADRAGDFNEAVMELGATVCLPRAPRCSACPLADLCLAHQQAREEEYPARSPRRATPHYEVAAAVLVRAGQVLVAQRAPEKLLGGMWEFPGGKQEPGETLQECLARELREELGIEVEVGRHLLTLQHAYTHFRITLHAFYCQLRAGEPRCLDCADARWLIPAELDTLPMGAADRQIAHAVQRGEIGPASER